MKHLNVALQRLEQRVAPSLTIGLPGIDIGIGIGGDDGDCPCTSGTDSCTGSHGSNSRSSKSYDSKTSC